MGRHSVDDDADDVVADDADQPADQSVTTAAPAEAPPRRPRPGRHARPDDDAPDPATDGTATDGTDSTTGRPDRPRPTPGVPVGTAAETSAEITGPVPRVPAEPDTAEPVGGGTATEDPVGGGTATEDPTASGSATAEPGSASGRTSDLELLATDSGLRARVVAAVIVPFLLYAVVFVALGATELRTLLIWVWLPLVSAGVLAGFFLDRAHRELASTPPDDDAGS